MSLYLIIISTICYFLTAIGNARQKDFPHAFIWFSYGLANCGFIWYETTKRIGNE